MTVTGETAAYIAGLNAEAEEFGSIKSFIESRDRVVERSEIHLDIMERIDQLTDFNATQRLFQLLHHKINGTSRES